jgi:hypothetical protein
MTRSTRLALSLSLAGVLATRPSSARADGGGVTTEQCLSSYTGGQRLRAAGALRKAREELLVCANAACPAALRNDCSPWLAALERLIPSVVLGALDERGHDLFDVNVSFDGELLVTHLDGRPIDLDPGEHVFRFEAAGRAPLEQRVLLREGEKARSLVVTLASAAPSPAAATPPAPEGDAPREEAGGTRGVPSAVWITAGVSVVSLGAWAYFFFSGLSVWNRDHDGGGTRAERDYVDTRWILADVTGGIAIAGAALATYFYLSRPRHDWTVSPAASLTGASVRIELAF